MDFSRDGLGEITTHLLSFTRLKKWYAWDGISPVSSKLGIARRAFIKAPEALMEFPWMAAIQPIHLYASISDGKGFILSTWTVRAEWTPVSCLSDSKGFSKAIIEGWWRKDINVLCHVSVIASALMRLLPSLCSSTVRTKPYCVFTQWEPRAILPFCLHCVFTQWEPRRG